MLKKLDVASYICIFSPCSRLFLPTTQCIKTLRTDPTNWLGLHHKNALGITTRKPVSTEQAEISRLRAELAEARMERDFLKKAAAYFAKA